MLDVCFLKSLEIGKAPISKEMLAKLADFMQSSKYIEELDLSWNSMHPTSLTYFLSKLEENKRLSFLNLSYNNIVEC